jgi:hypothetical protein
VNGNCDFCPRPARMATAMCVHEHRVGVWVCEEKHADFLLYGEINCRICYRDVPVEHQHFCVLKEVKALAAHPGSTATD